MYKNYTVMGIEAYIPGIQRLESKGIAAHCGDVEILESLNNNSISQIYMLFPDPWQKVLNTGKEDYLLVILLRLLKIFLANGSFQFTTDNINYAFKCKKYY